MQYQVSPMQKAVIERAGGDVNFQGDDNDLSCYLSNLSLDQYRAGNVKLAFELYLAEPLAVYGVTFSAWESSMKSRVILHLENEKAMQAHARSMERLA